MGTRFMATKEAPIHESIKQELVNGTERDTTLIMRTFKNTARIFKAFRPLIYFSLIVRTPLRSRSSKSKGIPKSQISRKSNLLLLVHVEEGYISTATVRPGFGRLGK